MISQKQLKGWVFMEGTNTQFNKASFAAYITKKRKETGLTQEELAKRLFVTKSTVSKWERGVSYPDISLVCGICRALSISEHEFFTACDDVAALREQKDAKAYNDLLRNWRMFFTICYITAIAICFICNLAIFHTLSWFWIVLTALMLTWCCTNIPLNRRIQHKGQAFGIAASGCLMLLLFACWGFVGGTWIGFGTAVTSVCIALPWGLYLLTRFCPQHRGFPAIVMAAVTGWTFLLVLLCVGVTGGDVLQAALLTGMAYVPAWLIFLVAAYLRVHACIKAGLYCVITDFAIPFFDCTINLLIPDGGNTWADYLQNWPSPTELFYFDVTQMGSMNNAKVVAIGLLASIIVLSIGIVLQIVQIRRQKRHAAAAGTTGKA
ncbi:MAG TPA: helix-turn-helix domain-containing protein [Candidatus Faecalibacterium avium]|nr:helix-turn-helix domain-containing protein [Candidatus Faecalibacterium avium]